MRAIGMGSARQRHSVAVQKPEANADWAKAEQEWYDGVFEVLALATNQTVDQIKAIQGATFQELADANRVVLEAAGLITEKKKGGEANATGEANGATG